MKYGGGFYILRIMLLCPPPVKIYSLAYWSARKPIFTHMKESSQYYFLGCQFTLRGRLSAGQISFFLHKKVGKKNFIVFEYERKEGLLLLKNE